MSAKSVFSKLEQQITVPLESIDLKRQTTFFMVGMVNPMGPTLGILSSDGDPVPGGNRRILWFSYNPFDQACTHVGDVAFAEDWAPWADLAPFMEVPFGAAPTLLIPGTILEDDVAHLLFARMLAKLPNGRSTFQLLNRFAGDPWKRIQEEMNGSSEHAMGAADQRPTDDQGSMLSEKESADFAAMQLKFENARPEFQAFLYAWNGAIEFSGLKAAIGLEEFSRSILPAFGITARMPVSGRNQG